MSPPKRAAPASPRAAETRPKGWANPWFQLALSAAFVTASELCLKRGATAAAANNLDSAWAWTGIPGLASPWVWAGIIALVISFLGWLYVLRQVPLSHAYPLSNVVHITIPLTSWILLGERIGPARWAGIALVLVGLIVVAKPFASLEERL